MVSERIQRLDFAAFHESYTQVADKGQNVERIRMGVFDSGNPQ